MAMISFFGTDTDQPKLHLNSSLHKHVGVSQNRRSPKMVDCLEALWFLFKPTLKKYPQRRQTLSKSDFVFEVLRFFLLPRARSGRRGDRDGKDLRQLKLQVIWAAHPF